MSSVFDRDEAVHEFDEGDLAAEALVDAGKFDADGAGAEHDEVVGDGGQVEQFVAGEGVFAVDFVAGDAAGVGAGGEDDVAGLQGRLAGVAFDDDAVGRGDAAPAVEGLDLVLLEQEGDAAGVLLHDFVFAFEDFGDVDAHVAEHDAEVGGVAGVVGELGRFEQGFGGDAAAEQAGAAEAAVFFDDRGLESELPGADGGDVAAGSAADDDHVVLPADLCDGDSAHRRRFGFRPAARRRQR
jgi:hypothetical protein